jgi:peptidase E
MNTKGILALIGSGEFTKAMDATDKFLLSQIKNPVVAIIPTAAGQEDDYDKWIKMGVTHFKKLNVTAYGVHLLTANDANYQIIIDQLSKANVFYFSGGDPGYLLDVLKDSKAWELINDSHNNGAMLIGSSAGAMVMGKKVIARIYRFFRTGQLPKWEDGLSLTDFAVIPHFDKISEDMKEEHINELRQSISKGVEIVGIDEDTSYILIEGKWKKMGKGKVHIPAFLL